MPCQMCDPAPHPNCETYSEIEVADPATGESHYIDVCLEHYQAVKP